MWVTFSSGLGQFRELLLFASVSIFRVSAVSFEYLFLYLHYLSSILMLMFKYGSRLLLSSFLDLGSSPEPVSFKYLSSIFHIFPVS